MSFTVKGVDVHTCNLMGQFDLLLQNHLARCHVKVEEGPTGASQQQLSCWCIATGHVDGAPFRSDPLFDRRCRGRYRDQSSPSGCHLYVVGSQAAILGRPHVGAQQGWEFRSQPRQLCLLNRLLIHHTQNLGLIDERQHEISGIQTVLLIHLVTRLHQRPHSLNARQFHGGQLVDANPITDDANAAVAERPAAGDHLSLPLAIQVHHCEVRDGAQVGVALQHVNSSAATRLRVQPNEL
mmetsp:Transcript_112406/g.195238  ORF Transcript_112406/g.195238 Transcript_112406/m.195238 type:complete len:238 (+) Transcript_112406:3508-4221(+)